MENAAVGQTPPPEPDGSAVAGRTGPRRWARPLLPGLVAGLGALALALFIAEQFQTPFLANLAIDSSSSILSPSGLSRVMAWVGEAGKAATLAGLLALQFAIYLILWASGTRRLPAAAGARRRLTVALAQIAAALALFTLLAGFFAVSADSTTLRGGEWGEFIGLTLGYAVLFAALAHGLDLRLLAWPLRPAAAFPAPPAQPRPLPGWLGREATRRAVLTMALGLATSGIAVYYLGRTVALTAGTGVQRFLNGIWSPAITPTADFYVVSKNIFDPQVDGDSWRLTVDGLVERPLELSLADLQALPTTTDTNTLICISNRVGDQLISNATWSGAQLREILERAGVQPAARFLKFTSADDYTESLPLDAALDENVRLVWLMNEEPLTRKHGYPLRAIIPGRYGMKNSKWITQITLQEEETRGYWVQRGWSLTAFIKTMSRIDVPGRGSHTVPGPSGVRGIAFAGDRGIDHLEVSLDDGETWHEARLEQLLSPFSWTRWQYDYEAETQGYTLRVRATDRNGVLQTMERTDTLPDGASGYHRRTVQPPRDL